MSIRRGEAGTRELQELIAAWREVSERDVSFELCQKGVDMRIGLDIASMTLEHQVDTLVLVTGDSDFVPAAKLARTLRGRAVQEQCVAPPRNCLPMPEMIRAAVNRPLTTAGEPLAAAGLPRPIGERRQRFPAGFR